MADFDDEGPVAGEASILDEDEETDEEDLESNGLHEVGPDGAPIVEDDEDEGAA